MEHATDVLESDTELEFDFTRHTLSAFDINLGYTPVPGLEQTLGTCVLCVVRCIIILILYRILWKLFKYYLSQKENWIQIWRCGYLKGSQN